MCVGRCVRFHTYRKNIVAIAADFAQPVLVESKIEKEILDLKDSN